MGRGPQHLHAEVHAGDGPPIRSHSTEVVEFSPTRELQQTLEVVEKNMADAD